MARINKAVRLALIVLANIVLFVLICCMLEGAASLYLLAEKFLESKVIAPKQTEYDADLGWVHVPDLDLRDFYGQGQHLRTNSQRLRADREFSVTVPERMVRAICSGDSFTLGSGVDNDLTWCRELTRINPRLETINMGQGGYGADQAYLWYKRDGTAFDHDILIFAFITGDFKRMSCSEFQGYGKPLLRMKDGELIVTNTPVPRGGYLFPRLFQHRDLLEKLALMRVARRLASDSGEISSNRALGGLTLMGGCKTEDSEVVAIVREMLVDLKETTRRKHSELVLVHLPMPFDISKKVSARWERVIADQAGDLDIPYVDLIPDLQRLSRERVMELIPGHFSAEGNRHFANAMYRRFMEIPQLAARLSPRE